MQHHGLELAGRKDTQRADPGFPAQVADGRTPGARRIQRSLWRVAVADGPVPTYRPCSVYDRLVQVDARFLGVTQAAPCLLQGG